MKNMNTYIKLTPELRRMIRQARSERQIAVTRKVNVRERALDRDIDRMIALAEADKERMAA